MNFKDKILLISGFILFISMILSLIFRDISFILFGIIIGIFLFYIYLYQQKVKLETKETLAIQHHDIIENKLCVKPSKDNPFMNPNILEVSNLNYNACDVDNKKVRKGIDTYFKDPVFKDVIDIYDRNFSERQFYTVPATTIPNDQEAYLNWLYPKHKTCKENNGERCYYNII